MPYKWLDILGGRTYTIGNNVQKALIQLLIFKKIFPVVLVEIYLVFPLLSTSIAFKPLSLVKFLEIVLSEICKRSAQLPYHLSCSTAL